MLSSWFRKHCTWCVGRLVRGGSAKSGDPNKFGPQFGPRALKFAFLPRIGQKSTNQYVKVRRLYLGKSRPESVVLSNLSPPKILPLQPSACRTPKFPNLIVPHSAWRPVQRWSGHCRRTRRGFSWGAPWWAATLARPNWESDPVWWTWRWPSGSSPRTHSDCHARKAVSNAVMAIAIAIVGQLANWIAMFMLLWNY